MEYIQNGDFATGDFPPWEVVIPPVEIFKEDARSYARFGDGARLLQRWRMTVPVPPRVTFSLDIKRSDDVDWNIMHLTLTFIVAGVIEHHPFQVFTEQDWTTASILLALPDRLERVELFLSRTSGMPGTISLTNVSFSDQVSRPDAGIEPASDSES